MPHLRISAFLTLLLVAALGVAGGLPARADSPTPAAAPQSMADCAAAGQVWLLVVDDQGAARSNQCVGNPTNGVDALATGGMSITTGNSFLICTIDGYPDQCPSASSGAYWTYFHADESGAWSYSQQGARDFAPASGTVEGWCFTPGTGQRCELPTLADAATLQVTDKTPVAAPASTPWELIGGAALIVVIGTAMIVLGRFKKRGGDGARGGR